MSEEEKIIKNTTFSVPFKLSEMKNIEQFEQQHIDMFYHLTNVCRILQQSHWYTSDLGTRETFDVKQANMPPYENTVFALTYIRQFIESRDSLLVKSCNQYMRFSDSSDNREYVKNQRKSFSDLINGDIMFISLQKYFKSNKEFIEAFLYGALIVHSPSGLNNNEIRETFKQLYMNKQDWCNAIFHLNFLLKRIVCCISSVCGLIQMDVAHWQACGFIPAADVFMPQKMFEWEPIENEKGE